VHIFADKIKTGSLLGITTNLPGMDIAPYGCQPISLNKPVELHLCMHLAFISSRMVLMPSKLPGLNLVRKYMHVALRQEKWIHDC